MNRTYDLACGDLCLWRRDNPTPVPLIVACTGKARSDDATASPRQGAR
jgi:hypothetical protein